ncbi:MAG: hypothetical protein K0S55_797 [Clostridia bacterium]|nr:hypothetical protein [Clostridia bacterium]
MENSRTDNVVKNMVFASACQVIYLILSFISRTAFINILGVYYLGVNGLFTNILTTLSFAELGIGNAIIFSIYKPLAENNTEKIKALMALYKKAYQIIGSIIVIAGLSVIPFLDLIIKDKPDIDENLVFIYILFLANTAISYFFIYKKSIITADQKNYIISVYEEVFHILQIALQILFVIITHNFILYLLIQIFCTFLKNLITSKKADKMYPYLLSKCNIPLSGNETKSIFANVRALFLYKFSWVEMVGICSNYFMIIMAISGILDQSVEAFTASVGNLNATEKDDKKENIFNLIFIICVWVYGFSSAGMMSFLNPFVKLWIGEKYLLGIPVVFTLMLNFYIKNVHFAVYTYRVILGYIMGLYGILLATSISRLLTTGIVDPYLVFKKGFSKNPMNYFIKYGIYALIIIGNYFITNFIISFIPITGWFTFFLKVVIFTIIFNTILLIVFIKTKEFNDLKLIFKDFISRLQKKFTDKGKVPC